MKKKITFALIALLFVVDAFSQQATETPQLVFESMYILPKRGMDDKFEAAVKLHNQKFHPDGPYKAFLRKVVYGDRAGWYFWVLGPTPYSSLDTRPDKEGGHADDWTKTVEPLVETYGQTNLWEYNQDLSFGLDILRKSKFYEVWLVDLKRGENYRFKAIAEKLKKVYESLNKTAFMIIENPLHTSKSADVGILWSFDTYAEWSKDPGVKVAYEKMYGAGSWQNMLDDWEDMSVDYDSEIRSVIN